MRGSLSSSFSGLKRQSSLQGRKWPLSLPPAVILAPLFARAVFLIFSCLIFLPDFAPFTPILVDEEQTFQ